MNTDPALKALVLAELDWEPMVKQKAEGVKRKLCTLMLTDTEEYVQIYGGEAVHHEGKVITRVRSGGYGFTVKKNI